MVKDIVDLRKFIRGTTNQTNELMMHVAKMTRQLMHRLDDDDKQRSPDKYVSRSPDKNASSIFESSTQRAPEAAFNALCTISEAVSLFDFFSILLLFV